MRVFLLVLLLVDARTTFAEDPPGGFLEPIGDAQTRPILSESEISSLVPERGKFTFPAPYHTDAFRLTNSSDCGGSDCVQYVGYSYWRNSNNHVDQNSMLVLVGLSRSQGGEGPSLIAYNKLTDEVTPLGPIFSASESLSWASGEGFYFSGTMPHALYIANGPRLLRYDVVTRQYETVFDVRDELGNGRNLWQAHSSNDDRVHSATLQNSSYSDLGCVVYREDTDELTFFPKLGNYDECQVDRSGKWLVIKENLDGQYGEDNRIINLDTLEERVLLDQDGAGGHSDMGHGYMVASDNWGSNRNTQKVWQFDDYPLEGMPVYYNNDGSGQAPAHLSHTNSRSGIPADRQFACGSSVSQVNNIHGNEIICFGLANSEQTLVVAPVMTSLSASGGSSSYSKFPKGNLDVTGRYFIWTSNLRSDRLDTFMVKVPAHLLSGIESLPSPLPNIIFSDDFGS